MMLPRGWETDVAVLRLSGAQVRDHVDHLVITCPQNPSYHWGNLLLVTDPGARDDADRWVRTFAEEFPEARHIAIGLPEEPDRSVWAAQGVEVESELVLSMPQRPGHRPVPAGYTIRRLVTEADWRAATAADVHQNARTGEHSDDGYLDFASALARARADLSRGGAAAFFGAFADDELVADLGIVLCGQLAGSVPVARYQSVSTAPGHRGRGLAGHLLAVAGAWAAQRGALKWEIHVDPGTPAHRLYVGLGFLPDLRTWQAYRPGPASVAVPPA